MSAPRRWDHWPYERGSAGPSGSPVGIGCRHFTAVGLLASALFLLARNPYGDSVRPKNGLRTWVGNPTRSHPKAQRSRVDGLGTPTARELSWFASKTSPHLRRTSVLPFRGTPRSGDGRRSPRSWLMLTPAGHTSESWRPRRSIPAEHTSSWAPRVSMPPHTDWMHSATCTHCFPETVLCEELRRVAAATLRCTGPLIAEPRRHARTSGASAVHVAAMVDAKHHYLAASLVDSIQHAVGGATGRVDPREVRALLAYPRRQAMRP